MITVNVLHALLLVAQGVASACTLAGGLILLVTAVDGMSSMRKRWPLIGLCLWSIWMLWAAAAVHHHDSPAAVAMTALVAFVLLRYGRQVRGILDGEGWWPPNAAGAGYELSVYMRPRRARRPWWVKACPWWALFGNDDDGYFGDADWRAGRDKTAWLAMVWWLRNPCHNFTWYVIGVADRERLHRGRWSPDIHRPDGGWLMAVTDVRMLGLALKLPFVSFLSPYIKAYVGWRPSGAFGIKLNLSLTGSISLET